MPARARSIGQVQRPADEIHAGLRPRAREHLGICPNKIGRRDHVEQLPGREGHDVFVPPADTADVGRCRLPPALGRQEPMGIDVERKRGPLGCAESIVLGQRALARVLFDPKGATRRKGEIFEKAHCRLAGKLHPLARSNHQMGHPVEVGACQRAGRQTSGEPCNGGMQGAVEIRQRVRGGHRPTDFRLRFRLCLQRLEFCGGCVDEGGCVGHWSNLEMRNEF